MRSAMTSITARAGKDRAARAAKAWRVNSSTTVRIRSGLPSSVRWLSKVVGPDVVAALGVQTRGASILQPAARLLDLADRDF